jgi:hypothetical protein
MARVAMVTRTVTETTLAIKCANTETEAFEVVEAVVAGDYKEDSATLKTVARRAIKDRKELVFMSCTVVSKKETLYGMTEEEFVSHATVLPPRGSKEN